MSQGTTLALLPQTGYPGFFGAPTSLVSVAQRGVAYYLSDNIQQTISWSIGQIQQPFGSPTGLLFVGSIDIQASISTAPLTDADWFNVASIDTTPNPATGVQSGFTNLYGNYVWIRVKVSEWTQGAIAVISVSY